MNGWIGCAVTLEIEWLCVWILAYKNNFLFAKILFGMNVKGQKPYLTRGGIQEGWKNNQ